VARRSGFRNGIACRIIELVFLAKQKKRVPWPKILHMLAGKPMLIAIPFAKLNHMVFSLFVKGFMGSEQSIARGALVWSS